VKYPKIRGIVAVLAVAVTALLGAGSASASSLIAPETLNTILSASAAPSHYFNIGGSKVPCTASNFEANALSNTHVSWDITSKTIGNYSCSFWGTPIMQWNGCGLTFHPGAETSPGTFAGTFDIGPAGCGPITMKYLGGSCQLTIYPKTGLQAEFQNVGSGATATVTITAAATGLKYTDNCGGSGENATYNGSWTLRGFSSGGTQVNVHLQPPVLFVSGKESADPAQQPKFDSDFFPIGIKGTGTSPFTLTTAPGKTAECSTSSYSTPGIFVPVSSKSFTASYSGCKAFGFANATVKMNSCSIVHQLANSGPPYTGSVSLSCEKAGDAMQISPTIFGSPVCTVSLAPQTLAAATYENVGSGSTRRVIATLKGSGISYSENAGGSCEVGSGSNGTLNTVVELTAFDHQ
jgi:hypothetical protein